MKLKNIAGRFKNKAFLIILVGFFIDVIIGHVVLPNFFPVSTNSDADYIEDGEYKGGILITEFARVVVWNLSTNSIAWQYGGGERGLFFTHDADILPNGNVMISDTARDRIIEVNMTTKQVVWELDFCDPTQFNWSNYADQWGWASNSYERNYITNQNPPNGFFTHINDFQYIENSGLPGVNCPTIQISVRNFDMLVEVTHNSSKKIVWHAGKPGDHSIMNHQHGPCYLNDSQTILIADSENYRCIEINRTGDIIWEYKTSGNTDLLKWVRDIDPLPNGNYLIDDSNNNRIIELDPETKSIVKTWTLGVNGVPYDADYVEEKDWIIVANSYTSVLSVIDYNTGIVLTTVGFPYHFVAVFYIFAALCVYIIFWTYKNLKKREEKSVLKELIKFKYLNRLIILGCLIFVMIFFEYVLAAWWFALVHPLVEAVPLTVLFP